MRFTLGMYHDVIVAGNQFITGGRTLYLLLLSLAANAVAKTVYVHFSVNCQTFLGEYIF
jgi:hypothetical protein